jgi:hypothetical protein
MSTWFMPQIDRLRAAEDFDVSQLIVPLEVTKLGDRLIAKSPDGFFTGYTSEEDLIAARVFPTEQAAIHCAYLNLYCSANFLQRELMRYEGRLDQIEKMLGD